MNPLHQYLNDHGALNLPNYVIDRHGHKVIITGRVWRLHTGGLNADSINISRYANPILRYAISKYFIAQIKTKASSTVVHGEKTIYQQLFESGFIYNKSQNVIEFQDKLIESLNLIQKNLRNKNKFSDFYEISRWYMWCADHLDDLGFCSEYALELSRIRIPGDIKGEAVRSLDPLVGPLDFHLEEPLVRKALQHDKGKALIHLKQRVAVALCLAFGRNPLNYARLREEDLTNFTAWNSEMKPLWQIRIPRIKKRAGFRELFKIETCDSRLAELIIELIDRNKELQTTISGKEVGRSIFLKSKPTQRYIGTDSQDYAFHYTSNEIGQLVSNWSKRMNLVSPINNEPLKLSPRRLRYTFACNMARQGVSRAALAEMLDHTDTQHVAVYYELLDDLVPMLDKALANKIGHVLGWFKGNPISLNDPLINNLPDKTLTFVGENNPIEQLEIGVCGSVNLCHLDPPYSCYLCPKFRPYLHADHDRVLEILLSDRQKRISDYDKSRLGVQLDDVIYAVAEAATLCRKLDK